MKPGEKVLDVCCGDGNQVFYYDKKGIISLGIDSDQNSIERAKNKSINKKAKNVSFQVADATKLPFDNNFFDHVTISLALHEKSRNVRDKVISEMKRVAKRNGNIIFMDFQIPQPKNLFSYIIKTIEYFAGKEHFHCFKDYIKQGGLDKLLDNKQLIEKDRKFFKKGNIVIIKTIKT
jgi:demethylmenaquinone methyltransferase/2-methoxy-6-polyprenyl-1,4-benzoquinol methylase